MAHSDIMVTAINAFNDNYIWVIGSKQSKSVALVDPGDAKVCIDYLTKNKLFLSTILITHHHKDHIGGIKDLLDFSQKNNWQVTVYGPANENIANIDVKLREHDHVTLAELSCELTVLDLPGHTKGHIAYYDTKRLFCGDTLFSGGCGRLFEGTPKQMHQSLSKLTNLPSDMLVYCAHEYTQANLAFALAVEPENTALNKYINTVKNKRTKNQATIPSTIGLEQQINPFLRCHKPRVKLAAQKYSNQTTTNEVEVFSTIRAWKDTF
jgi:hydroxyacylglutathione hydrolase